jgi:hypothetical protein
MGVGESADESGWTLQTLRVYLESSLAAVEAMATQRFENADKAVLAALAAQEKAVQAALAAAEQAVGKSEVASEKRFDATNAFRGQLNDIITTLMPRAEAEQRISTNADKIDELAARVDKIEGRSGGMSASWSVLIAALGAIGVLVAIFMALNR